MKAGLRFRPLVLVGVSCLFSGVSCGVPGEDVAHVIADEDLPFGLANAPSTSTTIDLVPDGDAFSTQLVNLYFPSEDGFERVEKELPFPVDPIDVIRALSDEPSDTQSTYRSAIGPDDVESLVIRGGVAEVELTKTFLDLPNAEKNLGVAQIVLSLTAQPGVGQINFVVDGEPVQVPRADGTLVKGFVSRDDFIELIRP